MSATNLWLSPERALIGVDTRCEMVATGATFEGSKFTVIPHVNAVLAGRGATTTLYLMTSLIWQSPNIQSFDSLVDAMPGLLPQAFELLHQAFPAGVDPRVFAQEFIVIGWSASADRVRAFAYEQKAAGAGFAERELSEPGYVCPWEPDLGQPEPPSTAPLHQQLLARQVEEWETVGGRLVLAEVTRNSVAITSHELPPPRPVVCTLQDMVITQRA